MIHQMILPAGVVAQEVEEKVSIVKATCGKLFPGRASTKSRPGGDGWSKGDEPGFPRGTRLLLALHQWTGLGVHELIVYCRPLKWLVIWLDRCDGSDAI